MKLRIKSLKRKTMDITLSDNPVFNVKGETKKDFVETMSLAFRLIGETTARGYMISEKKGIILFWHMEMENDKDITPLPKEMGPLETANFVWDLLKSDEMDKIELGDWDSFCEDGDVDCHRGWRIYTEKWGRIDKEGYGDYSYSFLAIIPSYLWLGK